MGSNYIQWKSWNSTPFYVLLPLPPIDVLRLTVVCSQPGHINSSRRKYLSNIPGFTHCTTVTRPWHVPFNNVISSSFLSATDWMVMSSSMFFTASLCSWAPIASECKYGTDGTFTGCSVIICCCCYFVVILLLLLYAFIGYCFYYLLWSHYLLLFVFFWDYYLAVFMIIIAIS